MNQGKPRPAATVVLTRPCGETFEVFMVKRTPKAVFMPSVHVFPGGRVDEGDQTLAQRLPSDTQAHALGLLDGVDEEAEAGAFCVAAVRETAEECGLLLARDADGHYPGPETATKIFEALRQGEPFERQLAAHALTPDLHALQSFAWWVTPDFEPRQYDTRFFVAEAPPFQIATYDAIETTEGLWITPAEALARFQAQTLSLAPPTLASLEILDVAANPEAALASIPRPIHAIHPFLTNESDGTIVLALPGDPLFPNDAPPALPHRTRFQVVGKMQFR